MRSPRSASLAIAGAAAALAGALAGCGGAAPAGQGRVATVTQAAYVTSRAPGFRTALVLSIGLGGHTASIDAEGVMDERDGRGSLTLGVAGQSVLELISRPYLYLRLPAGAGGGAGAGRWLRINLATFGQAAWGSDPFTESASGPAQMLGLLRSTGQVSTVGQEAVRGTPATHYRATVDLARYAAARHLPPRAAALLERATGAPQLTIDVWVDAGRRVRRFQTHMSMCTSQGTADVRITDDLFDYGPQQLPAPPPAGGYQDITGRARSALSAGLSQLGC